MNKKIENFKESMHLSMLENYKKDEYLAPVFFIFMSDGLFGLTKIPKDFLYSENKHILADLIKNIISSNPLIVAAGIIMEAYGAQISANTEMAKLILNGDIEMKDIKEKKEIIIMIFSTPQKEEFIAYYVDDATKTVGERFSEDGGGIFGGLFSHLFAWNKN